MKSVFQWRLKHFWLLRCGTRRKACGPGLCPDRKVSRHAGWSVHETLNFTGSGSKGPEVVLVISAASYNFRVCLKLCSIIFRLIFISTNYLTAAPEDSRECIRWIFQGTKLLNQIETIYIYYIDSISLCHDSMLKQNDTFCSQPSCRVVINSCKYAVSRFIVWKNNNY